MRIIRRKFFTPARLSAADTSGLPCWTSRAILGPVFRSTWVSSSPVHTTRDRPALGTMDCSTAHQTSMTARMSLTHSQFVQHGARNPHLWSSCRMRWCTLCLLYTSDAADDLLCVDLGGRRIIKKKKKQKKTKHIQK